MKSHYIPEDRFPMELDPALSMLGNYFFNLFLITGSNKTALFETGISGVVDQVIRQLDGLGVDLDYIILSHPHSDHVTGLPGLAARFPKAEILAAAGAREFVAHPKAGPLLIQEDAFMSQGLVKMGIQPGRSPLQTVPDLTQVRVIREETRIDLGGGTCLDLIPVDGHSPGNLIAWLPASCALLCSDSLGFHYPGRGFWPLYFTGAEDYLATLAQISEFSPDLICPAHQGPLRGAAAAQGIEDAIAATHKLIRRITDTGLDDETLTRELFEQAYVDEFTLYTRANIENCTRLLIRRTRELTIKEGL